MFRSLITMQSTSSWLTLAMVSLLGSKNIPQRNARVSLLWPNKDTWDRLLISNLLPTDEQTLLWPKWQKMTWHHEIADEKCYPMVCHMPTFAIEMNEKPLVINQSCHGLLWVLKIFECVFLDMKIMMGRGSGLPYGGRFLISLSQIIACTKNKFLGE